MQGNLALVFWVQIIFAITDMIHTIIAKVSSLVFAAAVGNSWESRK